MAFFKKKTASRPGGTEKRRPAESKRPEPVIRALKALHSAATPDCLTTEELERQRRGQELLGRLIAPASGVRHKAVALDGLEAEWTRPVHGCDHRQRILYCHGGGYVSGNVEYARFLTSKLAQVSGLSVLAFNYRLAPEHPHPAQLEDALRIWDHLMYLGHGARDIIVAGDSAGGHLALSLCHALRQAGRRLPSRLLLLSPWTDLTMSGRSYTERAGLDPILTTDYIAAIRQLYAPGGDFASPELSPLFSDFTGFPPTLIQVGTNELLLSDSLRLRNRMKAAGVSCRLEVWKDMWHVFQMAPFRQAGNAMDSIGRFLSDLN